MASDPKLNKDFDNRYDNSDLQMDRRAKDIAAAYTEYDEMKAYKMYLESLETEARVAKSTEEIVSKMRKPDGTEDVKRIPINELIPQQSEFEQARRRVIQNLNGKGSDEIKRLFAEFETESIWELSSKMTNFLTDGLRRRRIQDGYKFY